VRLKQELGNYSNVIFTNRVAPEQLVAWYQAADLLVFPSHTDTFGMVVLEGLACGLPALVSNSGGPKEIVKSGISGQIIEQDNPQTWLAAIEFYRGLKSNNPAAFQELRDTCAAQVNQHNNWQAVFDEVLGNRCRLPQLKVSTAPDQRNQPTVKQPVAA
jgi:glycosyltransferase involved in cell wall biosynthesis